MSEDINKKLKQITDILGQDNLPENIKGLLSLLASTPPKDDTQAKAVEPPSQKEDKPERNEPDDNLEMMRKVRKVIDKLNTNNDPRINLLTSIRPFMNEKRQKRVGDCIRILQMASLVKLIEDSDNGKLK